MVVATARVSRNAFYELFTDKVDCFIAACDEVARELLASLDGFNSQPGWVEAMRQGARHYLQWWQDRPGFAAAYLLCLPCAGERSIQQRERTYQIFRSMFRDLARRARDEQSGLPPLPEVVPRVLVSAITELVTEEVRAGRIDHLADLGDDIAFLAIRLLADDSTARRALPRYLES